MWWVLLDLFLLLGLVHACSMQARSDGYESCSSTDCSCYGAKWCDVPNTAGSCVFPERPAADDLCSVTPTDEYATTDDVSHSTTSTATKVVDTHCSECCVASLAISIGYINATIYCGLLLTYFSIHFCKSILLTDLFFIDSSFKLRLSYSVVHEKDTPVHFSIH